MKLLWFFSLGSYPKSCPGLSNPFSSAFSFFNRCLSFRLPFQRMDSGYLMSPSRLDHSLAANLEVGLGSKCTRVSDILAPATSKNRTWNICYLFILAPITLRRLSTTYLLCRSVKALVREWDSNPRPLVYETNKLPTAPSRNIDSASGDLTKRGIAYIRAASVENHSTASDHCLRIRTSTLRSCRLVARRGFEPTL